MNHCILGDDALFARITLITEILGRFVASAPRAVSIAQLAQETGRTPRELIRLCELLCREQLLQLLPSTDKRSWQLTCPPSSVTLEDAYRCALAEQASRSKRSKKISKDSEGATRDVDLLLMQASVCVNQSVQQLLRQFSLDRLKISAAGVFPARQTHSTSWSGVQPVFS